MERRALSLSDEEALLMQQGLAQWGGPGSVSDPVAAFVGYPSAKAMDDDRPRLNRLLAEGVMEPRDWRRVMLATEIAFVSDMYGAGVEWSIVTPFVDAQSVEILRRIQRKLIAEIGYGD
jgi:hypothetical protein